MKTPFNYIRRLRKDFEAIAKAKHSVENGNIFKGGKPIRVSVVEFIDNGDPNDLDNVLAIKMLKRYKWLLRDDTSVSFSESGNKITMTFERV